MSLPIVKIDHCSVIITDVERSRRFYRDDAEKPDLRAGFGACDITPKLDGKPVYLAGFAI